PPSRHLSHALPHHPPAPALYTLSLHDALPILPMLRIRIFIAGSEFLCSRSSLTPCEAQTDAASAIPSISQPHDSAYGVWNGVKRSEEHTSELQSLAYLVCRLLLQKNNNYPQVY